MTTQSFNTISELKAAHKNCLVQLASQTIKNENLNFLDDSSKFIAPSTLSSNLIDCKTEQEHLIEHDVTVLIQSNNAQSKTPLEKFARIMVR